jgi:argininosuccinate lyase
VRAGVPFREAHGLVGRIVRRAEDLRVPLREVPAGEVALIHGALAKNYRALFDMRRSVETRSVVGGTSAAALAEQIEAAKRACGKDDNARD